MRGENEQCTQDCSPKSQGTRKPRWPRRKWEDNIKIGVK